MSQTNSSTSTVERYGGQSTPCSLEDGSEEENRKLEIGVSFMNFNVQGRSTTDRYQYNFLDYLLAIPNFLINPIRSRANHNTHILRDFEGLIRPGEMLLVLGRPGSGCSTFLKSLAGNVDGLEIRKDSQVKYQGIGYSKFHRHFQGERAYVAELDVHFPELTLGQTLDFAASTRSNHAGGVTGHEMALQFGLGAALDTPVGDAMTRGLSGGEKRRTSIAEACLGGAQFQCWDNSTRGLDSSTARRFVRFIRHSTDVRKSSVAMTIYQASEDIYQQFDNVILLYEGREIFYGPSSEAVDYFQEMGFVKPDRVTTADFLTSLTNPAEAQLYVAASNKEHVPRLPDEFANNWKHSPKARQIRDDIANFHSHLPVNQRLTGNATPAQLNLRTSTYPLSISQQVAVCVKRSLWRTRQKFSNDLATVIANIILGLIIGSVYYDQNETTDSLQSRSILLFFALILNAFAPAFEVLVIWAQRPIVEKHHRYAFYQPFTERLGAFICDIPIKVILCFGIHIPIYLLSNLRRSASAFFLYWLFMFVNLITMSMLFRMIGSVSRTRVQTLVPVSFTILLCIIYTGFVVPPGSMVPWFGWFWRINPLAYTYENLMLNEMHDRLFPCSTMIPSGPLYDTINTSRKICPIVGSEAGQTSVQGSTYLSLKYEYTWDHLWRNFGVLLAMLVVFCACHLVAAQVIPSQPSRGEVLVFKRNNLFSEKTSSQDEEKAADNGSHPKTDSLVVHQKIDRTSDEIAISQKAALLSWTGVNYHINGRAILQNAYGWLQPGTLTVLMGVTGAGKTSLLNVLADRVTAGRVTGDISVGGRPFSTGYQRRLGYVQQEDIHMATTTVREALEFSALMRQPKWKTRAEKLAFVDEVLDLMGMQSYADAVVGVPGEGLNLEQRKRLTIAVEMVARPELLLLVDEPTSGLDSQTAWSICMLLRKLADNGQSILCTIHQPSFQLFSMFDRLLLLGSGGKTLYFGDIGPNASTIIHYFESNGAPLCQPGENPAEWMIDVTTKKLESESCQESAAHGDWADKWSDSQQRHSVLSHLDDLKTTHSKISQPVQAPETAYATSIIQQVLILSKRTFIEQWRSPAFLMVKIVVFIGTALLNGFSFFNQSLSVQGITSLLFSIFFSTYLFSYIVQTAVPTIHQGRELFKAREGNSKTYSWVSFLVSYIAVEVFWQTLIGAVVFAAWYYPTGLSSNGDSINLGTAERGALTFVLVWLFMLWASTLSQALAVGIQEPEVAMQIGILLYWMALVFCGVLVSPSQLPRFWIFMYRISPLTYLMEGLAVAGLSQAEIRCSDIEMLHIPFSASPVGGNATNCYSYLQPYIDSFSGYVANPSAISDCKYCPVSSVNTLLEEFGMDISHTWRNVGLLTCYVCFNILAAFGLFWATICTRKMHQQRHSAPARESSR